ncbi:arginine deiminase-related protein [Pseudonocardia sp.]|uniref:dimethylarginine dimethylaminohydrolase family protein n=1 Tax=Pseudonocardia sp. TaxID=60912 RepID=UPI0026391215|nr:arginine deiminase-related protein [Pseudonocardia sp.]
MNTRLLVSDADNFRVDHEINPYMSVHDQPDRDAVIGEHAAIVDAHRDAGRRVERLSSAAECPDMVFTANAALVSGDTAVLGRLPPARRDETPHHRRWLRHHGFEVHEAPHDFSGQGDALPCGNLLLAGHGQRTDRRMHGFLAERLGYRVVSLRTVGPRWYDLDLAVAVIDEQTLAWFPAAFDGPSRDRIRGLGLDLIEVTPAEAGRFALNLISDGSTVTMTDRAPGLAEQLRDRGLAVVPLSTRELAKGGGGVRCTALTLYPAIT